MRRNLPFVLAVALIVPPLAAQERTGLPPADTATVVVRMTDRTDVTGRVVLADSSGITIRTQAGTEVRIPARLVASWRRARNADGSVAYEPDPSDSRLFFSATARTLPQGRGYFAVYEIFFPYLAVGVTDRLTLAGGMSLVPGAESQLIYFTPKLNLVRTPTLQFALGGGYATVPSEDVAIATGYGVLTAGTDRSALHLSVGWIGDISQGDEVGEFGAIIGLDARGSERTKFMAEAWIIRGADVVPVLAGVRFIGRRMSADFGLLYPAGADTEGFPFLPWIGFAIAW